MTAPTMTEFEQRQRVEKYAPFFYEDHSWPRYGAENSWHLVMILAIEHKFVFKSFVWRTINAVLFFS